jgi:LEA14-like dessication related protein
MKRYTWTIAIAMPLVILLSGCDVAQQLLAGAKKPTASLKGLSFGNISLDSATLLFDVEVTNPYAVELPLLNMDYAVATGSNKLFSGKANIASTIPANGSKVVSLPAKIGYVDVAKAFMGMKTGSSIPYNADLGLSFNAPVIGEMRLPLNKSGELKVPSLPDVSQTDWQKLLLEKARQKL